MPRRLLVGLSLLLFAGCSEPFCEAGATRCGAPGTAERERCAEDGAAFARADCAATEVCLAEGGAAVCRARACGAGSWRCPAISGSAREVCAEDGLSFVSAPCAAEEVCVTTSTMVTPDGCEPRLCAPGSSRCSGEGVTAARQECDATGARWLNRACTVGKTCLAVSADRAECRARVCDRDRCSADLKTRLHCLDSGTAVSQAPCGAGEACVVEGAAVCRPVVCPAGEARCPDGVGGARREACNESGTAWVVEECTGGAVCSALGTCSQRICAPGATRCDAGFLSRLECDSAGTSWVPTRCLDTEACSGGECKTSPVPLGGVAQFSSGPVALLPGRYAMAVSDADLGGSDAVGYPVELTGSVLGAPLPPPAGGGSAPLPRPRRGGAPWLPPRHLWRTAPAPPPPPVRYEVGDTRVFRVPTDDGVAQRTARLIRASSTTNLWEDQTSAAPGANLSPAAAVLLATALDQGVVSRNRSLFASSPDVDGNGRFDVLFTDLLPTERAAAFVSLATLWPPGSCGADYDFGEISYSMPLKSTSEAPVEALILAHEFGHLMEYYRRVQPYLAGGPGSVPDWVWRNAYLHEGAAQLAAHWSGQGVDWGLAQLLLEPETISLSFLAARNYLDDLDDNGRGYALGALAVEYAFGVAGAVQIESPGTVVDRGGRAWVEAFLAREDDLARVAPLAPGRAATAEWWADLAVALLFTTLEGKLGEAARADPRFRLPAATVDATFKGLNGPPLRWEQLPGSHQSGPLLAVSPWASRPATFRRGGLGFVVFSVGEQGATLSFNRPTVTASLVRYE